MADRGFINHTPFAAQELYLADEEGRELLVVVIKATYAIGATGVLALMEEQPPVEVAGMHQGEPGVSSYRYEPQVAPFKLATDVILIGHAYADRREAPWVDVQFRLGPVNKLIRVFGDRHWVLHMGLESITPPHPFEKMPLIYERAFGGWDRSRDDPEKHIVEKRNPVGVGYHNKKYGQFVEGSPLPNLEDPKKLIKSYMDAPPPAGFGFIGPDWAARAVYTGTYDEAWMRSRMPLLPVDFDQRFYNAAPPDQIAPSYLNGKEFVRIVNAVPEGHLEFYLPGELPPRCTVTMNHQQTHTPQAQLDTVIVNTDERNVSLIWRAHMLVPGRRLHDIRAITVEPNPVSVHAQEPPIVISGT